MRVVGGGAARGDRVILRRLSVGLMRLSEIVSPANSTNPSLRHSKIRSLYMHQHSIPQFDYVHVGY